MDDTTTLLYSTTVSPEQTIKQQEEREEKIHDCTTMTVNMRTMYPSILLCAALSLFLHDYVKPIMAFTTSNSLKSSRFQKMTFSAAVQQKRMPVWKLASSSSTSDETKIIAETEMDDDETTIVTMTPSSSPDDSSEESSSFPNNDSSQEEEDKEEGITRRDDLLQQRSHDRLQQQREGEKAYQELLRDATILHDVDLTVDDELSVVPLKPAMSFSKFLTMQVSVFGTCLFI
uniref:Uncharacterized protein n=1 Tax=Ditylum brightwellii TaxID=49249 RepID=A0A6V2B058_9STRA|mmetsp:Transcript_14483/g.21378  ORF Transcript_14483/g.21378 Transcript_14483/m.21378 type:complete len:231 (+) Transcript_14483:165-857(+)